jgi:hypothetical protein
MRQDRRTPDLVAQVGVQETNFAGLAKAGFERDSTRTHGPAQHRNYNRCKLPKSRRGGVSAAVTGNDGHTRRKFICAGCVWELQGAWRALAAHAEALERRAA